MRSESGRAATPARHRTDVAMAAVAAVVAFVFVVARERLPVGGGLGWDGVRYADVAIRFPRALVLHEFTMLEIQRCFPQAFVHLAGRTLGRPMTPATVVDLSAWLDALCIVGTALVWGRIADALSIGRTARWIGFAAQVLTYPAMTWAGYAPVQTDSLALLLGACAVLAFLRRAEPLLALVAVAGAFTWPTSSLVCLPLLLFPRPRPDDPGPVRRFPWTGAALVAAGIATWGAVVASRSARGELADQWGAVAPWADWFPVSIAVAAVVAGAAAGHVLRAAPSWRPRALAGSVSVAGGCAALVVLAVAYAVPRLLSNGASGYQGTPSYFVELTVFRGIARPAVFVAAHALYFGPAFVWVAAAWPRIADAAGRLGPGPLVTLAFLCWFSLTSESRHLLMALPLVAALLSATLGDVKPWRVAAFAALCVGSSGLLTTLAPAPTTSTVPGLPSPTGDGGTSHPDAGSLPLVYALHAGPWMPDWGLWCGLAATAAAAAVFPWRRRRQLPGAGGAASAARSASAAA